MIHYLLSVSICWVVFYLTYVLFLERETFFKSNRFYLLGTIIAGLCIPLIHFVPTAITVDAIMQPIIVSETGEFINKSSGAVSYYFQVDEASNWNWQNAITALFLLGVLLATAKMIYGLIKIYGLYKNGTKTKTQKGIKLVSNAEVHLPFSFLSYVFVHPSFLGSTDAEKILDHESVHINGYHTLDILLVELISIAFWWNPIIYLYRRSLKQTHEYLADYYASLDIDKKNYGHILLGQASSGMELALTHPFFNSHLKKRIDMLFKEKSAGYKRYKYVITLPIVLLMFLIVSCTSELNVDLESPPKELVQILDDLLGDATFNEEYLLHVNFEGKQKIDCDCPKPDQCMSMINPEMGPLFNYIVLLKNEEFSKHKNYIEDRFIEKGRNKGKELSFYPLEDGIFGMYSVPLKEEFSNFTILEKLDELIENSGYSESASILYRYNEEVITREEIAEIQFTPPFSFYMCFAAMDDVKDEYPMYTKSHEAVISLTLE